MSARAWAALVTRRRCLQAALALAAPVCRLQPQWTPLFDGTSLGSWEQTSFGGEGPVAVRDGAIVLGTGDPLTGITWTGPSLPAAYSVALDAARLSGNDFFCGLTFPVQQTHCTLVLGGWGGTTAGLSTLDGRDASDNETTREIRFEDGRWYDVRIEVGHGRIRAWLDGDTLVDVATAGRRIGIRPEVDPSRPFGIASFRTRAGLRRIRMRPL